MSEVTTKIDTTHSVEIFQLKIKRLLDISVSIIGIVIFSPIFLIIMALIKLNSKGPVFFRQTRVGKHKNLFRIYKFRTMIKDAEKLGAGYGFEKNDRRITRVGRILRFLSFDELPELINVLKGEMSIIGPRPTLKYQVEKYNEFQKKRLLMKPGITGLAQIKGRNELTWSKRIEYDVTYVENFSFLLDLKIFLETFKVWLFREGIRIDQSLSEVEDFNSNNITSEQNENENL